ncbi:MAG TPA: DNA polymerase III subunit gamma/tau [Anaerolineales bacterium]|nr:DNA polymerase III subunit gamma/tau [Anaerolineales bacterium]
MTQVLYRQWRPQSWEQVVGQDHVVQTLRNAVRAERLSHAYLFAGPRGTGKTTTARLLAKAANCLAESPGLRPCNQCDPCRAVNAGRFLDLIEIDAASNTSVEDVRELRERIHFAPNEGRFKVYIVDEVHMLSAAAFNALLKTLEEPPAHALFVLATTEVHKIPATVLSRCQRHEFRRLPARLIVEYLEAKAPQEGISVEREALGLIARQATGSLRDAISLLDQLAYAGERVTLAQAEEVLGTATAEAVRQLVQAMAAREVGVGLAVINQALDGGADARQFGRQVVQYLRDLLLLRMQAGGLLDMGGEALEEMRRLAGEFEIPLLLEAIRAFGQAAVSGRESWQPALRLELALVESLFPASAQPPAAAESRGGASAPSRPASPAAETIRRSRADEPPPSPVEVAAGPRPGLSSGPLTFQAILERWDELLAAAQSRDVRIQALLADCKPLGLENRRLVLGFRDELRREKIEKKHNQTTLAAALKQVFGQDLGVRCVLVADGTSRVHDPQGPLGLEEGGMVATALRDLGAQVITVEQLPQGEAAEGEQAGQPGEPPPEEAT